MNIRLYMLGTGSAVPLGRGLPCIALRVNGNIYVFDAGEGCQERMFKIGLSVVKVKAIFVTHLHGDHFFGIPGMIQSMYMLDRAVDLYLVGPTELWDLIKPMLKLSYGEPTFRIHFTPAYDHEVVYEDKLLCVEAFKVDHIAESYGYKIDIRKGSKTIVYTGDTRPIDTVADVSRGADILIHEATFTSDMKTEAYEQGHSTAADAAKIASKASVRTLILTHISSRYDSPEPLFYDAYRFFKNVIVAEDYMIILV